MRPVRLAVIGVGDVAQRDYLPEFHRLDGRAEIAVVCGRTADRTRRVAEQYQVPGWVTDAREAVECDVDAVVNLTPIDAHFAVTHAALLAGRHVYTEKPLAGSPMHARKLMDEAADRGLALVSAPSILLFPQIVMVRSIISSGELGTVHSARAHAITGVPPWPGYDSDPAPFFVGAAGPLVDMAVYPLHALTGLLGPARSVAAMAARTRETFTVAEGPHAGATVAIEGEDQWQLILKLGECVASVEASFATVPSSAPECELRGDRGAVSFSLLDVAAPVSILRPGAEDWTELSVAHERESGPDHILGVEHLLDCIQTGTPPVASAAHALHVLEVIDAARRSLRARSVIEIEPAPAARVVLRSVSGGGE